MQKFFAAIVLAIFVAVTSSASAAEVQIYDRSVDDIIADLKSDCAKYNVTDIWGTEYYTYQGARRCEVNFGDTKDNVIRFRLNDDNSVARLLITIPNSIVGRDGSPEGFMQASFVMGSIFKAIGLSESEARDLGDTWTQNFKAFGRQNPHAHHYHEKFSVWCSRLERNIVLDVEPDDSKFDWYIYAYI